MTLLGHILGQWVETCARRARFVMIVIAVLTALAGTYVALNFAVDSDLDKLINPSDELGWFRANEAFKAQFPESQQTSIVVISGATPAAVDDTAGRLAEAFRASGDFEFVFAPALDPFLRDHRAYFLETDDLDAWISGVQFDYGAMLRLADGADLSSAAFTTADQIAATDGLRLPTLLASIAKNFQSGVPSELALEAYPHLVEDLTEHYLIIMLKGRQALDESLPNAAQVALIRSIIAATVAATGVDPGVRVRLTGEVPLAHEEISSALDGIGIAGAVSLILLAVVLRVGVGSWRIIGSTFGLLGVGVVWTLAFATFAVGAFNTLALMFVGMFFGLGVDFAVHFSLRLQESLDPDSGDESEVSAAREIGPALLLCMLTSSIAFLSFVPTEYRGLGELGIISAGGLVIAFVLTLSFIPAFFSLSGMPPPRRQGLSIEWARKLPGPGALLSLTMLVALSALWFARDLNFDYSVLALRDADTEAMSTLLEMQESELSTDYSVHVLVANAMAAAELKSELEALDEIGQVLIPTDLIPSDQEYKRAALSALQTLLEGIGNVEGGDPTIASSELADAVEYLREVQGEAQLSDQPVIAALLDGLTTLYADPDRLAALNKDVRVGLTRELLELDLLLAADPFTFQDLPEDLRIRLVATDGTHLVTVMPAGAVSGREATDAFVQAVMKVTPAVAGRAVVEWGAGGVAVRSFLQALAISISAIALLLVIYFRGIILPIIVLIPLALTTLLTFAIIELTPLTLNMANILVIPLIFGLGVDTGIHVVHRFTATGTVSGLLASSTTRAVVISALTTIGTFFSLSFSPHKGAASVGLLLTIAISIMVLVTFIVVPAMLSLWSGGERVADHEPLEI